MYQKFSNLIVQFLKKRLILKFKSWNVLHRRETISRTAQRRTKIVSRLSYRLAALCSCLSLDIGLATIFRHASVSFQMHGRAFERVVLQNVGKLDAQSAKQYPTTPSGKEAHFDKYSALIVPFLLPEISLEADVFDAAIVEIFTRKFGPSIRHAWSNSSLHPSSPLISQGYVWISWILFGNWSVII